MKETCNALTLGEILNVDEREIRRLAQKGIVKRTHKGEYKYIESIQGVLLNEEKKFLERTRENLGDKLFDTLKITIEIAATRELSNAIVKAKYIKQLLKVFATYLLPEAADKIEKIMRENKNGK